MGVNDDTQEMEFIGSMTVAEMNNELEKLERDMPGQTVEWSGNNTGGFTAHITPCRFDELLRYMDEKQRKLIEEEDGPADDEDEPQPEPPSSVDHPSHYRKDSGYEAIDVIEAWGLGFSLGNAVKYICRAGLKQDALEDLEKAEWYLRHEIERRKAAVDSTYK